MNERINVNKTQQTLKEGGKGKCSERSRGECGG